MGTCRKSIVKGFILILLIISGFAETGFAQEPEQITEWSQESVQTPEWSEGYAMIVMNNQDNASANQARDYVISQGGRVAVLLPPHIMFGWFSPELASKLIGKYGIEYVSSDQIDINNFKYRDERSLVAVSFFNSVVGGDLKREATLSTIQEGEHLSNDVFPHPQINYDDYKKNLQNVGVEASLGNSDSMTGTVAVTLFFVESNGAVDANTYNWSPTDQQNTVNRAISGLSWWSNKATAYGKSVSFSVYLYSATTAVSQQNYEPILHRSTDDGLWISQIMGNLGYTSGDKFARVTAFNTWLKGWAGTDWAYSVFVGYNPSPAPNTFQAESGGAKYFAYTFKGGPYIQMLFRNEGWVEEKFGTVLTHETGHVFWACDEYFQAGYGGCTSCDVCDGNGPRPTAKNGNCSICNSNSVACMMRGNEDALCPYTPQQIGWSTTNTTTRTLTVASSPSSGVGITVSPTDNSSQGSGTTQFTRTYNDNTVVTLTAPATAGSNSFRKWQRDGVDFSTNQSINVTMDANHTVTVVYGANALAQMTSPSNGSTFSSSTVTFNWSPGSGNTQYFLYIGNSQGSSELFSNYISGGTTTVSGIPTDGRTIWVRLWSLNGTWAYNDYSYRACSNCGGQLAQITNPANGSTFNSSTVTFNWDRGSGNTQYFLYIGNSQGSSELFSNYISGGSTTVSGIPTDGRTLWVRIWSLNGTWAYRDYSYKACSSCGGQLAQITNPANGSTLNSSTVTFNWDRGSGNTQYFLYIGSSPGSSEYFYNYISGGTTTVSGIPTDGRTIWVRIWSLNGTWAYRDYSYKACSSCGGQLAQMTSPANGSTFNSSSVTFNWSLGSGNTQYFLYIGNSQGSSEYYYSYISGGTTTVSGIPTDGRTIWVRLWSLNGTWAYNDYSYKACSSCGGQLAQIISPANGSTFNSSTVTFNWDRGSGNTQYFLYIGNSQGSSEYYYSYIAGGTTTVNGLPTDGRTLWVRIWSLNGTWAYRDYIYKASG